MSSVSSDRRRIPRRLAFPTTCFDQENTVLEDAQQAHCSFQRVHTREDRHGRGVYNLQLVPTLLVPLSGMQRGLAPTCGQPCGRTARGVRHNICTPRPTIRQTKTITRFQPKEPLRSRAPVASLPSFREHAAPRPLRPLTPVSERATVTTTVYDHLLLVSTIRKGKS